MDRYNLRNLACAVNKLADAMDEIARLTGAEPVTFFSPLAKASAQKGDKA